MPQLDRICFHAGLSRQEPVRATYPRSPWLHSKRWGQYQPTDLSHNGALRTPPTPRHTRPEREPQDCRHRCRNRVGSYICNHRYEWLANILKFDGRIAFADSSRRLPPSAQLFAFDSPLDAFPP